MSGVVTLDYARARFTLLVEVARSAGWNDLDETEVLVAEFIEEGHVRLHRQANVESKLAAHERRVLRATAYSPENQQRQLQILADRFREVTLYQSDNNRVHVSDEVAMALVGELEKDRSCRIYLQAGIDVVEVMTHSVRMKRLREFV